MNKQEIYDFLDRKGIRYEVTEHPALFTMEQAASVRFPHPEAEAKNLFVRDDKKQRYYLITVKGDKRVDLKLFRHTYQTRPLTFASPEELMALLDLEPGSVTPLGLLNDGQCRVELFLDQTFLDAPGMIGIHPNENTATLWMRAEDLIALVRDHGNKVSLAPI